MKKIALFCNVKEDCVIQNQTLPVLYEAPLMLEEAGLARIALRELKLQETAAPCDLAEWRDMVARIKQCREKVRIALVGKYVKLHDSYLSIVEALRHGGWANDVQTEIRWIDSEQLKPENLEDVLGLADGIIIPGRLRQPWN